MPNSARNLQSDIEGSRSPCEPETPAGQCVNTPGHSFPPEFLPEPIRRPLTITQLDARTAAAERRLDEIKRAIELTQLEARRLKDRM